MIRRRADRHWRRSATLRPRCKVRLHAEALGSPQAKAVLAGIAAMVVKRVMQGSSRTA
jgi:hypothetical protein